MTHATDTAPTLWQALKRGLAGKCPACGEAYEPGDISCMACGTALSAPTGSP